MYALPNNKGGLVFEIARPWDSWTKFPIPTNITTKPQMETWRTDANTKHAFISGVGGRNPQARITGKKDGEPEANDPATMSALICDYDTAISDEVADTHLAEPASPILPNYIVDSFSEEGDSGRKKRRLVWLFESPVRLAGMRHATAFFKVLRERLRLSKRMPGFDENGHKPTHYFEIGRNWRALSNQPIPLSMLLGWAAEAAAGLNLNDNPDRPAVDIEKIAAAVADKFPGRWQGDFTHGSQGVRFWDPTADNERGCLVGEHGMICFTGDKSFVSWEHILGQETVDSLRGDQWGNLIKSFYWDGKHIWRTEPVSGVWLPENLESARRSWRVSYRVSASKKGKTVSDLEKLEEIVCSTQNRVFAAFPFVHRTPGEFWFEGRRYLNTTNVRVLDPAPAIDLSTPYEWEKYGPKYFTWAYEFLDNLFEPAMVRPPWVPVDVPLRDVQLMIFLAWLQRCYTTGYRCCPLPRQAIVLAGPEGVGKTFLVTGIMAALLGSVADGASYMVDGSQFNSLVAERPINFIDDATPATSPELHRRFTAMIKKMVSCSNMAYNQKYGGQGNIEWIGCTILSLNLDPESQRNLPSLDQSTLDKFSFFQVKRGAFLPGKEAQARSLEAEMKFFARFLLEWTPPAWTAAPASYIGRFGVRSYHHASLREAASSTGTPNTVLNILREVYDDWCDTAAAVSETLSGATAIKDSPKKAWVWEGRAMKFCNALAKISPRALGKLSDAQVESAFSVLASKGFTGIEKLDGGRWRIRFDESLLHPFDPTKNTEY